MSGLYPGSIDLVQRVPVGKQDHRSALEYAAALARETERSLRDSPRWCAGLPLAEDERWPNLASDQLGSRSGGGRERQTDEERRQAARLQRRRQRACQRNGGQP